MTEARTMITTMPDTIQTALFTTLRRIIALISMRIGPVQNIKNSRGQTFEQGYPSVRVGLVALDPSS